MTQNLCTDQPQQSYAQPSAATPVPSAAAKGSASASGSAADSAAYKKLTAGDANPQSVLVIDVPKILEILPTDGQPGHLNDATALSGIGLRTNVLDDEWSSFTVRVGAT